MAYSTRTKRISIAAGALSIALVAPFVSVSTSDLPAAHAQTVASQASDFDTPEEVNFWDATTVQLKDIALNTGDKVETYYSWTTVPTYRWKVTVDDLGVLTVGRPTDGLAFSSKVGKTVEIPIKVSPIAGESYEATLKIAVKDEKPAEETAAPETTTAESTTPETTTAESEAPAESSEPEAPAESEGPSTSEEAPAPEAPKFDFDKTYEAENFWNKETVAVPDAKLEPGDTIASTYWDSTTRWPVEADAEGNVTIGRPWNKITFNNALKAGSADIPVTITPKEGEPYSGTLKVKLTDTMPPAEWEGDLPDFSKIYSVDFEKQRVKPVPGLTLPENLTIERSGAKYPLWSFTNVNGEVQVNAPATFTPGVFDLPVKISDGTSTVERTIRINATNPQTTGGEIAKGIGGALGPILGGLIGGGTGGLGGTLGNLLGGLIGGGSGGSDGSGDGKGGSGGGLLGNLKGMLEGLIKIEDGAFRIENNGNNNGQVTVTGNANPTVNISDNGSNNGNPQVSVVVTDNAKVNDSGNNNGNVTVTGNANPTVNISDNGNNNGNPNVIVTNNANPTVNVSDNANNNASNNGNPDVKISDNAKATVVVTGNANPTVNVSDNGNNNGNPDIKVTGNANPTVNVSDNANNNGNPDIKVTGNANPDVKISDNGNNNGNPIITNNANPNVQGLPLSSGGGSSKGGEQGGEGQGAGNGNGGSSNLNARVGAEGGISDPRCIATLVGLGVPLLAAIPVALSNQLGIQAGVDSNSINRALRDTARSLNVDPSTLTAVGGGLVGVVVTLLAIAGLRSCIPNVKDVDITVGSSGKQGEEQKPTSSVTTTAPVVPTTPAE